MKNTYKKSWSGRFEKKSHPLLEKFNASLSFDKKLYAEDIAGSLAHATMLKKIKVLTGGELKKITQGLLKVKKEIESGKFKWKTEYEDIHMAIEARLTDLIGATGGKLHTARSRNDQVATDLRLYCKNQTQKIIGGLGGLQKSLIQLAKSKGMVPMPGYTHLQRAQPILLAHNLLAYVEMLKRDKERLNESLNRLDVLPLGSGALAGSTFPLDRKLVAKLLGFKEVSKNSLDAVSDRDFVAEILFCLSLLMTHLSRFCEELILWSSQEFGFIRLPEEFCTGSSMMPQKINPDVPELVRGKTGRVYGSLISILTTLKGLPLAYNKDLQEDKEPLFDALDQVKNVLEVLAAMVPSIQVNSAKMELATKEGFLLATDLADYLVSKKIPFRKAHEITGKLIQYSLQKNKTLEDLSLLEFQKVCPQIKEDVYKHLNLKTSINKRNSVGGTSYAQVKKALSQSLLK